MEHGLRSRWRFREWRLAAAIALASLPATSDPDVTTASPGATGGEAESSSIGCLADPSLPPESGQAAGVVEALDLPEGLVLLRVGARRLTLHAHPAQLAGWLPGAQVQVPWVQWGTGPRAIAWLSCEVAPGSRSPLALQGELVGTVASLKKSAGVLELAQDDRRIVLHARPELLRSLLPGLVVRVSYQRIGAVDWVFQIAPGAARSP